MTPRHAQRDWNRLSVWAGQSSDIFGVGLRLEADDDTERWNARAMLRLGPWYVGASVPLGREGDDT